jgi:hypothetical protein
MKKEMSCMYVMDIMLINLRKADDEMRTQCAQLQFPAVIVLINLYHLLSLIYTVYTTNNTGTLLRYFLEINVSLYFNCNFIFL